MSEEQQKRERIAKWFHDAVVDGGVRDFALIAITKDGGKVEMRTPGAPKNFSKSMQRARRNDADDDE